jgi:hypothetical protein
MSFRRLKGSLNKYCNPTDKQFQMQGEILNRRILFILSTEQEFYMKKFLMTILFIILIMDCGNIVVLSQEQSSYNARELSRDENYKLIEMYVYDNSINVFRKITFELPVEWEVRSSTHGTANEQGYYVLKVDIWDIRSATRESVLDDFNNYAHTLDMEYISDIFEETIYTTENYEIFYTKFFSTYNAGAYIHMFYLYANGERFALSGYVFVEDKPEYDNIFKRIAESVRFQPDANEVSASPATGDNILTYIVLLLVSVIFMKKISIG